ncbi:MAG: hypothetical protein KDE22_13505 [Rhodobacterales bacterium]|nr:hypothetical protein [Rhodobacterales bacterium]
MSDDTWMAMLGFGGLALFVALMALAFRGRRRSPRPDEASPAPAAPAGHPEADRLAREAADWAARLDVLKVTRAEAQRSRPDAGLHARPPVSGPVEAAAAACVAFLDRHGGEGRRRDIHVGETTAYLSVRDFPVRTHGLLIRRDGKRRFVWQETELVTN